MDRLPVAALLVALAACQRTPARIYSDADIAKLEERVLAKVAETDASCVHPELLELVEMTDTECFHACQALEVGTPSKPSRSFDDVNVDSNEVAAVDEKCAERVLTAFGRAALTSPGCSPYQVGVRGDPIDTDHAAMSKTVSFLHATHIMGRHALRETDPYVGFTELLVGVRVTQDLGRGRIDFMQLMLFGSTEKFLLNAGNTLLARSSFTKEQLDDIAANLDAAIATEPGPSEVLQGEPLTVALHMGLGRLKPEDWQPPGGRGGLTEHARPRFDAGHDWRDDAAKLMDMNLRLADRNAQDCPLTGTYAACYAKLNKGTGDLARDLTLADNDSIDRHAVRVGMFPDDDTRHDSQRQLVDEATLQPFIGMYLQTRTQLLARLVALRLRVQVLRDGRCPSETQLREAPYSTLRAPTVLGDSLPITMKADSILVGVPDWARNGKYSKFAPISIPCP